MTLAHGGRHSNTIHGGRLADASQCRNGSFARSSAGGRKRRCGRRRGARPDQPRMAVEPRWAIKRDSFVGGSPNRRLGGHLGSRIDVRRRFVEDQHRRVGDRRPTRAPNCRPHRAPNPTSRRGVADADRDHTKVAASGRGHLDGEVLRAPHFRVPSADECEEMMTSRRSVPDGPSVVIVLTASRVVRAQARQRSGRKSNRRCRRGHRCVAGARPWRRGGWGTDGVVQNQFSRRSATNLVVRRHSVSPRR